MSDLPVHAGYFDLFQHHLTKPTRTYIIFSLFYPCYNQLHYYEINAVKVFHEFP